MISYIAFVLFCVANVAHSASVGYDNYENLTPQSQSNLQSLLSMIENNPALLNELENAETVEDIQLLPSLSGGDTLAQNVTYTTAVEPVVIKTNPFAQPIQVLDTLAAFLSVKNNFVAILHDLVYNNMDQFKQIFGATLAGAQTIQSTLLTFVSFLRVALVNLSAVFDNNPLVEGVPGGLFQLIKTFVLPLFVGANTPAPTYP